MPYIGVITFKRYPNWCEHFSVVSRIDKSKMWIDSEHRRKKKYNSISFNSTFFSLPSFFVHQVVGEKENKSTPINKPSTGTGTATAPKPNLAKGGVSNQNGHKQNNRSALDGAPREGKWQINFTVFILYYVNFYAMCYSQWDTYI